MKRKLLLAIMLVGLCGCVTRDQINDWTTTLDAVVPAIKEVQAASGQSSKKLDKVLSDVERVNEAVATAETPEEAIRKGIDASKPFNPYADEMNALLGAGILIAGWFGKKKLDTVSGKYSAMKTGVNKFMQDNNGAKDLYTAIGDARRAKKII